MSDRHSTIVKSLIAPLWAAMCISTLKAAALCRGAD